MAEVRRLARAAIRSKLENSKAEVKVVTPDYLDMLLDYDGPPSVHLRPLIEVVACSRMLEQLGSTAAARKLIRVYVRFGEFLRVDTQMSLSRLDRHSLAALIETTRHPAPRIAQWAERLLRTSGYTSANQAIVGLPQPLLPDVLRAYGRTRSLPAFGLLLSYATSPRPKIRQAARQAITHIGHAGLWQLRDAYETSRGKKAPETWTWAHLAKQLFAHYDKLRLAELYRLFSDGQSSADNQQLPAAIETFNHVLSLDPTFERAAQMLPTYWQYAQASIDSDPAAAGLALRRIERLSPQPSRTHKRALSLRYSLDARNLLETGWVDRVLLSRALQLDPDNALARTLITSLDTSAPRTQYPLLSYLPALFALLLTALAMALQIRRHYRLATADSGTAPPKMNQ